MAGLSLVDWCKKIYKKIGDKEIEKLLFYHQIYSNLVPLQFSFTKNFLFKFVQI